MEFYSVLSCYQKSDESIYNPNYAPPSFKTTTAPSMFITMHDMIKLSMLLTVNNVETTLHNHKAFYCIVRITENDLA